MGWLVIFCWLLCFLMSWGWLWLTAQPAAETAQGTAPDPYAGLVSEFRRALHDWDRDGRQ